MTGGRSDQQMADIVTRKMKDLHLEIAKRWGIPPQVLAGTTFGLGVTMLFESGYSAEQIVEIVHQILGDLARPPEGRGAS
jgi:hypothetical protein